MQNEFKSSALKVFVRELKGIVIISYTIVYPQAETGNLKKNRLKGAMPPLETPIQNVKK